MCKPFCLNRLVNCIFLFAETTHLILLNSVESCNEAVLYFVRFKQEYNFFCICPRCWEEHFPISLRAVSKSRLSAVKPLAKYLSNLRGAVEQKELLSLQPHTSTESQSVKEYLDIFECILLSSIWSEILTLW
jgi:hypothetical protein